MMQKTVLVEKYHEQLLVERDKIKKKLNLENKRHCITTYKLLSRLYTVEKELRKGTKQRYTYTDLAMDNNYTISYISQLMSLKRATPWMFKQVNKHKISMHKLLIVLRSTRRRDLKSIKEIIQFIIDNNIKEKQICTYLCFRDWKKRIEQEKEYRNHYNISRDLILYCGKLTQSLLSYNKVPPTRKKEVDSHLNTCYRFLRRVIENGKIQTNNNKGLHKENPGKQ